jgi:hypothetical protein
VDRDDGLMYDVQIPILLPPGGAGDVELNCTVHGLVVLHASHVMESKHTRVHNLLYDLGAAYPEPCGHD